MKYSGDSWIWAGNSFSSKFVVLLYSKEVAKSQTAQSFCKKQNSLELIYATLPGILTSPSFVMIKTFARDFPEQRKALAVLPVRAGHGTEFLQKSKQFGSDLCDAPWNFDKP